jgi:hypothetical protein
MATRRQRLDPLKSTSQVRWLARLDQNGRVQTSEELAPQTDLRMALSLYLEALSREGWLIEGVAFSGSFVRKGSDRHYVSIYAHDPSDQFYDSHGPYPMDRIQGLIAEPKRAQARC